MSNTILQDLLAQANAAAEASGIDMNEAQSGGGGARMLPAGYAFAQLVEYIEFGNHAQEFQGKAKDPALEVQLGFALSGAAPAGVLDPENPTRLIPYNNDDGTPYIVRPYSFPISRNEKARAFLLFKALNWKGTAKSFAQLLGQKWLVKIVHEPKSKTDATLVSRIDLKSFLPPLNPVGGAPYDIQDADPSVYRLFLWDRPTKAAWDAIKIDGTYEVTENGVKSQRSKNRLQERCLAALNYQGSTLQQLLGGAVMALPGAENPTAGAAAPASPSVGVAAVTPPSVTASAPAAVPGVASVPLTPTAAAPVVAQPAAVASSVPAVGIVVPTATAATPVTVPTTTSPSNPVLPA